MTFRSNRARITCALLLVLIAGGAWAVPELRGTSSDVAHFRTFGDLPPGSRRTAAKSERDTPSNESGNTTNTGPSEQRRIIIKEDIWRSEVLNMLGIGMSIGDVTGNGKKEIVIIGPETVYLYSFSNGVLGLLAQYSKRPLELKSVDVANIRGAKAARIYVSAQNRGTISSFVLEYRNNQLVPVIENSNYFLRVIQYPTQGPFLLGQRKSMTRMYDGPILHLEDKGDTLKSKGRFGVPLKIPVFGFAIGDIEGNRQPVIAVYDRSSHLRLYTPAGKRLYKSREYYGDSDVPLRFYDELVADQGDRDAIHAMERDMVGGSIGKEYYRPRILAEDVNQDGVYSIFAIAHASKTRRLLSETKMLEEGQVVSLRWNGDTLEEQWHTPPVQGIITDFAIDTLQGVTGRRLITLERKKTDWLSFFTSESQIRAYDLDALMSGKIGK